MQIKNLKKQIGRRDAALLKKKADTKKKIVISKTVKQSLNSNSARFAHVMHSKITKEIERKNSNIM